MTNQNKKIIFTLPLCTASFISGILVAGFTNVPFFIFYFLSIFLFIVCLLLRDDEAFSINLLGLAFFIGAAHLSSYQALPKNHIANANNRWLFWQDRVLARGVIIDEPQVYPHTKGFGAGVKEERVKFVLQLKEINIGGERIKVAGRVLANVFGPPQSVGEAGKYPVSYGDEVILEGKFFRPHNFGKSSNFDYRRYLTRRGIHSILNVKKGAPFEITARHRGNFIKQLAIKFKNKIESGFYANMPQSYAAVLSTMLLGDRSSLPKGILEVFVRTGTAHILAISGMNIAITAFILLVFLKVMRIPRKPRYILTILLLIFYNFITGAQPSVTRAVIMGSVLLVGLLLEREVNIYNSLALAALILLAQNPLQIQEIGFQLSFVSVVSIVYLSPRIEKFLRLDNFIPKFGFIIKSFSVSLAAWTGTFLFIIYYFKIISPVTILANLVIVPLVGVLTVAGFILILGIFILPAFVHVFGLTAGATVYLLIKSAELFSLIPGAYFYIK